MQNISIKTENTDIINNLCKIYSRKILDNNVLSIYIDDLYLLSKNLTSVLVEVYEKRLISNIISKKIKETSHRKEVYNRAIDYIYDTEYEFSGYFRKTIVSFCKSKSPVCLV